MLQEILQLATVAATACGHKTGNRSEVIFYKLMRLKLERKCRLFLDFFNRRFSPVFASTLTIRAWCDNSTALELGGEGGILGQRMLFEYVHTCLSVMVLRPGLECFPVYLPIIKGNEYLFDFVQSQL